MNRLIGSILVAGLAACAGEPTTRVDFVVDAEASLGVTAIRFQVVSTSELPEQERSNFSVDVAAGSLPLRHPLTPADGDASRSYRVTIRALSEDGSEVGVQTYRGRYVSDEVVTVSVRFTERCRESSCDALGLRCDEGLCVPPSPSPETQYEPETRTDLVIDADEALAVSRVSLRTPGSIAYNFDASIVEPATALPLTFTARRERESLGPHVSEVTFFRLEGGVEQAFARQTVQWSFVEGTPTRIHIALSSECANFACDGLGFRCTERGCEERCVQPQAPEHEVPSSAVACEAGPRASRCVAGRFAVPAGEGEVQRFTFEEECLLGCENVGVCRRVRPSNLGHRLLPEAGAVGRDLRVGDGEVVDLDVAACEADVGTVNEPYLVCAFDNVVVEEGGELRIPARPDPVVLLVSEEIVVQGRLSIETLEVSDAAAAFGGGDAQGTGGGGGGGFGAEGGRGGDGSGAGGAPGNRYVGPLSLEPLPLGGAGGDGASPGKGEPGGSVQMTAGVRIVVDGAGSVGADGSNGGNPRGGGGGSGGALLFEAPEVRIRSGRPSNVFRRISVAGGAGGYFTDSSTSGGGGRIDSGRGFDGGTQGPPDPDPPHGGGGGGGVGMIRINAVGATRFDYENRMTGVWDQTMSVGELSIATPDEQLQ